jgi:tripartite-type tricarboxylate transporter receptor subunit TctC
MHRSIRLLLTALLAGSALGALAQAYPSKPVRMVVPFPPGGVNDNIARALSQSLNPVFNQPIVVENRAGANGNIGMENCARSTPDGYTLCFPTGVVLSLNPFAYSKMPFEPLDLVPVIHVGTLDQALAVNAALPVKDVRELVEYAKARPGQVSFASLGMGSTAHLYQEWFKAKTGAQFLHVPFKGSPELIQQVVAGEINVSTNTPAVTLPHVKSGKVRVIAVVAEKGVRSSLMPDVPTLAEQGYDLEFRNWLALYFPQGTPGEIARRWNTEVNKLVGDRAWSDRYVVSQAVTPTGGTPEFLVNYLRRNREMARELVKIANLKLD